MLGSRSAAYLEGQRDYYADIGVGHNPYRETDDTYDAWESGWEDAREEDERLYNEGSR